MQPDPLKGTKSQETEMGFPVVRPLRLAVTWLKPTNHEYASGTPHDSLVAGLRTCSEPTLRMEKLFPPWTYVCSGLAWEPTRPAADINTAEGNRLKIFSQAAENMLRLPLKSNWTLKFIQVTTFQVHPNRSGLTFNSFFFFFFKAATTWAACREGLLLPVQKQWSLCKGPTCPVLTQS